MQFNFFFYRFVSSSLFFMEVVIKLFDYFWKPNSLFSKFYVNCPLMFYFVYCNSCALKDVIRDCQFNCSLVVLGVTEMCFWPAKLEKTLNFLRCIHVIDLVLKYGSDIIEGNLIHLLFYVIVLMSIVASVIGMSFFSCVSSFRLNFSHIALWPKRLQLDSKSDLTTTGLFIGLFLVGLCLVSSSSYLHELKSTWNTQLFFYLTISVFLDI